MDFSDTPELADFRKEVRDWLDNALKKFPEVSEQSDRESQARDWHDCLNQSHWLGISWSKDYGGRGLTELHTAVFNEECILRNAPTPIGLIGILLAGPTILAHGSEEQKLRYLPDILSGKDIWCQGFSEPDNGSDLAGLKTCAVSTEGGWLVNGQKVWTSSGHLANKCMLLARTKTDGAKHHGLSYFLADTCDFDVRPLRMLNGDNEFNEMFIDDVFLPCDSLLGKENSGWIVAMTTLTVERSSVAFNLQVWARQMLDRLIELVIRKELHEDTYVLDRLGSFESEVSAIRIGAIRSASAMVAGEEPGAEASALKLQWARAVQEITRFCLEIGEPAIQLNDTIGQNFWVHKYLRARGHSIEGGTDEIQKSIIAERILHLPKSR